MPPARFKDIGDLRAMYDRRTESQLFPYIHHLHSLTTLPTRPKLYQYLLIIPFMP
jgi:hypothetical protein